MFITLLLMLACVYLVYYCICRRFVVPVNPLVPVMPGNLPMLGHSLLLKNVEGLYDFLKRVGNFTAEKGGVATIYFGLLPFYVVSDAEDVATVLNKCLDKMFIYNLVEPVLGKTLVAAKVPIWKRNRRIVDQGFKQRVLDDYMNLFNDEAERLVQDFAEYVGKGEVNITDKVTRSVLETSCRTTLGTRSDGKDLVNDKYVEAVDNLLEILTIRMVRPWLAIEPIFNRSRYKNKLDEALEILSSLSMQMVKLRRKKHLQHLKDKRAFDTGTKGFRGLLDILIENSVTETESIFNDNELVNIVDNVLIAGFDTTITEVVILLVCLGSRPDVQENIYEEIMRVLDKDGKVTKDNISQLVYLEAAIKESIRLHPIAPVVGRQAATDVKLSEYTIPAGSNIIVHLWAASRNPKNWGPDAHEYKPERWFSDTLPEHPPAFASFSPGRRGCPGKSYALMYLKTTLVPLIRKYKFSADLSRVKFDVHVIIKPKFGHHIKIEYRS